MLLQTGNRFYSGNVLIWESSILMLRLWNNLHFQRVAKEIRWCVTNQTKKIGIHLTMTSRLLHHELYLLPDCADLLLHLPEFTEVTSVKAVQLEKRSPSASPDIGKENK